MSHRLSLVIILMISSGALLAKEGQVNTDGLNMRLGPAVSHPIVGVLPMGAKVTIGERSGEWIKINPQADIQGYVLTKMLKGGSKLFRSTDFKLEASESSRTIGRLKRAQNVKVLGTEGDWSKVSVTNPKGLDIYVHGDYITPLPFISLPKINQKIPFEGVKPNYSVLVYDVKRKKELWSQNPTKPVPIASVTKMMTLLLALEELESNPKITLDTMVPISAAAAAEPPTKACLIPGQKIKLGELLSVMIIISCNDCAACAGEFIGGGTTEGFAKKANAKAKKLRMKNTQYFNAHGLPGETPDKDNVSTPRDLVKLAKELWKHDLARKWVKTPVIPITTGVEKPTHFRGHTPLLGKYGVDGIKTGYTRRAGCCVVTHTENEAGEFIVVILGCETGAARNALLENIMKWVTAKK
ncbi:MAG: SH3 domain-containing protein [Victivallales bacterium]|nr:SH3 domain-containing protein [Victivallales bacterium]